MKKMNQRNKPIVLDTWSILAYLEGNLNGKKVAELIADSVELGNTIYLSAISLGEIYYAIAKNVNEKEADKTIDELLQMGIIILEIDTKAIIEATKYQTEFDLSISQCLTAIFAKRNKAVLLTFDNRFKKMEQQLRIQWIKPD
jgi:predicted nucleic acid-binding protein